MKSEEIARLAGVSRSTVSRVINGYSNVPRDTHDKVMGIIQQYGYEPNTSARALAGKGSRTLGLFIISIADKGSPNRIYQNNYFAPFLDAVVDTANSKGYYVLVNTIYSKGDYAKVKQAFRQKRIDGGIIIGTGEDTVACLDMNPERNPLVLIDCNPEDYTGYSPDKGSRILINSMDTEGTENAVNYLVNKGHKNIGIITGRLSTYSGRQRFIAFKTAMEKNGLKVKKEFVLKGDFLKEKSYQEVKKLLKGKKLPSALFVSNDDMALSAIQALEEDGIRVPGDMSVIGFDDIPVASRLRPALTTVRVPVFDMAKKAVEEILKAIDEDASIFSTYNFPSLLIERNTVMEAAPQT